MAPGAAAWESLESLEALEEQGWRPWTGGRPSRSSSTHLSACAGEGFGFWPRCRSCLGDESLPVAFLSREPGGREQKHIPSFSCLSPRHRSPPACSDCAKKIKKVKSSSSWKKLRVCTSGGAEKPGRAVPHNQLHTAPSTASSPSSCWNKASPWHCVPAELLALPWQVTGCIGSSSDR